MAGFQVVSDLHPEPPEAYDIFKMERKSPYLFLLGDIGYVAAHREGFLAFLREHLLRFEGVFLVLCNHEPYHSTWEDTIRILQNFETGNDQDCQTNSAVGEFRLLNRSIFRPPGIDIAILGCSLFSHVPPVHHDAVSFGLKNFYDISSWDIETQNAAHQEDLAWLNEQVSVLEKDDTFNKIAIFTYWSPTIDERATDPAHSNSSISSGFATDLSSEKCWAGRKVKAWCWSHTHFNCDFEVMRKEGLLRAMTNQRGYYLKQSEDFDGGKVLML